MQKQVNDQKWGQLVVVSGPAGSGKTTLVEKLVQELPFVEKSISYTTRRARENEVDGVDYHFISKEEFEKKRSCNDFLEYVSLFGYSYGTCIEDVQARLAKGKYVVLVIDTQGAINLFGKEQTLSVFVSPPSLEELASRLRKRQTESEEKILERLERAKEELKKASLYDYLIVNDEFHSAFEALKSIIIAQEHRSTF